MAREPRIHFPGAIYHVYGRGNQGQEIFRDWRDYTVFLEYLTTAKAEFGFKLHAYCLMPNHYHMLIQVGEVALSKIMQDLISRYSQYFNRQNQIYGHVFQGRYAAKLVETEAYFLGLIRYIHLNPVGVHLRERPEHWRWSGHAAYMGTADDPLVDTTLGLSHFGSDLARARRLFSQFMEAGMNECVLSKCREFAAKGPRKQKTGVRPGSDPGLGSQTSMTGLPSAPRR